MHISFLPFFTITIEIKHNVAYCRAGRIYYLISEGQGNQYFITVF